MASLIETEAEQWVTLATLLRPQGRRGEILADLHTDFPEQLVAREHLYLSPPSSITADVTLRPCSIYSCWSPKGKNEGRVVLGIAGISTISEAEGVSGWELRTPVQYRKSLPSDETYIDDLLGCTVFDRGVAIGSVTDVEFPTSTDGKRRLEDAPALLVVTGDGGTWMVPFVQAHIDAIDRARKQIRMTLPTGLLDAQS